MEIRSVVVGDRRGEHLLKTQRPISRRFHHFFQNTISEFHWDHIIDVGANYGEMLVFTHFPENLKIWAFEPNSLVYNCLRENLSHLKNFTAIEMAVGSFVGEVQFQSNEVWSGKSHITKTSGGDSKVKYVPIVTLDHYFSDIRDTNILVKIDVEGHDLDVLFGSQNFIKINKQVFFLIENNGWTLSDYEKILDSFRIFLIDSNVKPIIEVPDSLQDPLFSKKILFTGNNCLLIPKKLQTIELKKIRKLRPYYRYFIELISHSKFMILKRVGFYK